MRFDKIDQVIQASSKIEGPFYFYDLELFQERLQSLKGAADIKLWYAMKSNPLSSLVKMAKAAGYGIDCASMGEIEHALANGYKASEVIVTGPAKSLKYINQLLKMGIETFVIESENQLKWFDECGKNQKIKPKLLLRFQKSWKTAGKNVIGGDKLTQFGLFFEDWKKINPKQYQNVNIIGFHIFQWGNIATLEELRNIWRNIFQDFANWNKELDLEVKILDLGGGLGIPYGSEVYDLNSNKILELLTALKTEHKIPEIWMELGRYLSGPTGAYCAKVQDIKVVQGQKMVILDGGINHLVRGNLSGSFFPVTDEKQSSQKENATLYGPLCTSLDCLGAHELSKNIEIGDGVILTQCGAYGFTESMPLFLCHDWPAEVTYKSGKLEIIRETMKPASWLR